MGIASIIKFRIGCSVGENEDVTQELFTLATTLYGSQADLAFVTRMTGKTQHADEIRTLLRTECGLVQDPVTETWMQLVIGRLKLSDLKKDVPSG